MAVYKVVMTKRVVDVYAAEWTGTARSAEHAEYLALNAECDVEWEPVEILEDGDAEVLDTSVLAPVESVH